MVRALRGLVLAVVVATSLLPAAPALLSDSTGE
jgi:hypothetical protein